MKKFTVIFLVFVFILTGYFCAIKPVVDSLDFPEDMIVTAQDIATANEEDSFSPFVSFELDKNLPVSDEEISPTEMKIKLFGFIPVKKIRVHLLNSTEVYAGGNTVGFYLNSDGVMIVGSNPIFTDLGSFEPIKECDLKNGDIIKKINNFDISSIEDIEKALNSDQVDKTCAVLDILRDDENLTVSIKPALDLFTKKYKLGLWVQNSASGVGTLTYIKKNNNRFGAVGHPISSEDENGNFKISDGSVYLCNYLGIKKGTKKEPGEIKTSMKLSDSSIGNADTNCDYGVYGNITNSANLDLSHETQLGGRLSVKMGDAKIYCDLDGNGVKAYNIKIVKTSHQEKASDKSIMFRVTDKELIEKTGGIIQGMSGSPIIQDGKLVGAVTHVFLNDPTKAFGVYIDWMIDN